MLLSALTMLNFVLVFVSGSVFVDIIDDEVKGTKKRVATMSVDSESKEPIIFGESSIKGMNTLYYKKTNQVLSMFTEKNVSCFPFCERYQKFRKLQDRKPRSRR